MQKSAIARTSVDSSSLASVGYSSDDCTMVIEFSNGSVYRYSAVSRQVYEEIMRADSKGAYFNRCVRPVFPHEKLA